jgi:hypothetical protein
MKLNTKIGKIMRTNKVMYTTSVQKQIEIRPRFVGRGEPWCSFLLAAAAALCAALVWWVVYVRGSRGWRLCPPTAGSGGGVAKGAPEPTGQPPSCRYLWSHRARRDAPPLVAACGVTEPDGAAPLQSLALE